MEFFLDKHLVKKQRSFIAIGGHQLPDNWVYPKKRHRNTQLPPCAGGPIPAAYAKGDDRARHRVGEDDYAEPKVNMEDDESKIDKSEEVKKERNKIQEYRILSFVHHTGNAKKKLGTIQ
jgi:hypothetical protein